MTTNTRNPRRAILAWYAYAQSGEPGARRGKHARPIPVGLRNKPGNHGLESLIDFTRGGQFDRPEQAGKPASQLKTLSTTSREDG
jgi:hypothetical protein